MRNYQITYVYRSQKTTITLEEEDENAARLKFTKIAPDVPEGNILSIVDLSRKKVLIKKLWVSVIFTLIGFILYVKRGFFASIFLGANTIGNMGFTGSDGGKVAIFFLVGGGIMIMGSIMIILELLAIFRMNK